MNRIVILASGNGSNAERIATFFADNGKAEIVAILTNKQTAKVIERAKRLQIPAFYFTKTAFSQSNTVVKLLQSLEPDLIVLAGFLWKIPSNIISAFPNKIINIHPALLPKYGGKGMFGSHVHQAVKDNKEMETGITIHYVNENYDEGGIIHQAKVSLESSDDVESIADKVHQLEYEHFPKVIETLLEN
ncbi:phosphoribosylglycinamide formyltransferase [Flagellimonas sp.]|uniref:phosphoribosylglycinamide formyltransferase n=1 Tax=Flagellimonas sp. TaxID=2058762 RepID=UPI003F4A60A5